MDEDIELPIVNVFGVDFLLFVEAVLFVEAFDQALLIWFLRWENRDIPRDEKLGEFGTDLGLKKVYSTIFEIKQ